MIDALLKEIDIQDKEIIELKLQCISNARKVEELYDLLQEVLEYEILEPKLINKINTTL